jgi:hypothetical protein
MASMMVLDFAEVSGLHAVLLSVTPPEDVTVVLQ